MRILTAEQHAQIVEALDNQIKEIVFNQKVATTAAYEALAVLQALPEVEVVGYEVWEAMCEPQLSRTKGGIKSLMKKLYATKDKT